MASVRALSSLADGSAVMTTVPERCAMCGPSDVPSGTSHALS